MGIEKAFKELNFSLNLYININSAIFTSLPVVTDMGYMG
jgi:hypothetical protein